MKQKPNHQDGFTIIELLIALSVMSVVLVMSSVILTQIGRMYNKGVRQANIQSVTRNIIGDIGSALEFGAQAPVTGSQIYNVGGVSVTVNSLCLGTRRYSYVINQEVSKSPVYTGGEPQTYHALWEDTMQSNADCLPMDITQATPATGVGQPSVPGSGQELIPLNSRLSVFTAPVETPVGSGLYPLAVTVAYGDNDLLNASGTTCLGAGSDEYCATSSLTTVVTRRLD